MDVSIVIPNYNGMKYMENCLRALEKQRVEGEPETEILVVDNGSKDGSRELVEEKFPQVRVIALDDNYGFCGAVNAGIRASQAPFVILLNRHRGAKRLCVRAVPGHSGVGSDFFRCGQNDTTA